MESAGSAFGSQTLIWLLIAASVVAMIVRRIKIPYSLALVCAGLAIGALKLLPGVELDPELVFAVFLPPLLFEAALNIDLTELRRHSKHVTALAVAGVVTSAVIVGLILRETTSLALAVAVLFGTVVSSTDPVAVLALFKELRVPKGLSILVKSESLLNDGTSIVIFTILLGAVMGRGVSLSGGIVEFFKVSLGGLATGLAVGYSLSLVTSRIDDHLIEITLTTVAAYGSYVAAHHLGFSGVIATVFAGLVTGSYGLGTGMSPSTQVAVQSFWEYIAFLVNSLVFLLIGIEVTLFSWAPYIKAAAIAVGAVVAARAVVVYFYSNLMNLRGETVPPAWQHVVFWGGLKGALSMALVLGIPRAQVPQREEILVMTFSVVLFSLVVQGLTMRPLLRLLGLIERPVSKEYEQSLGSYLAKTAATRELSRLRKEGLLTAPVFDNLNREYTQRMDELESTIAKMHSEDESLKRRQTEDARKILLMAEKTAVMSALRSGLVSEETARELIADLDGRLRGQR
jgi:CPA1 family monovalent cation:H+ antiporter